MINSFRLAIAVLPFSWVPGSAQSYACTCAETLDWTYTTLRDNDAGYPFTLERKGVEAHDRALSEAREEAAAATTPQACKRAVTNYLRWFRKGHLEIYRNADDEAGDSKAEGDWPTLDIDTEAVLREANQNTNTLSGIWSSGAYTVAIAEQPQGDTVKYVGVITETDNEGWKPGQVKFEIYPEGNSPGGDAGTLYMGDHSPQSLKEARELEDGILAVPPVGEWQRIEPAATPSASLLTYLEEANNEQPTARELSLSTMLVRIPSFGNHAKSAIDSILGANEKALQSHENLIVDVRGNGGGSDFVYARLLDYIYTHPIRQQGLDLRSTLLNNSRYGEWLATEELDSKARTWMIGIQERLADKPEGSFVAAQDSAVDHETRESVYSFPKRIAVLVDGGCGSTCEQFVLDARQRFKTKIIGALTYGAIDASNMAYASAPCGNYELGYSTSISYRGNDFPIDDYGLQPDIYLERELVPEWERVGYAQKVLEQQ